MNVSIERKPETRKKSSLWFLAFFTGPPWDPCDVRLVPLC